jgi:hypothetical protein
MTDITVNELPFPVNDETPAESRDSRVIRTKLKLFHARSNRSAFRQPQQIVLDQLAHILADCDQPNWDGYGALPVTRDTLLAARRLFEQLESCVDVPDVTADPDGDVAFEWNNGCNSLTVAVNSAGDVAYAAYFGDSATAHGTEVISDSTVETVHRLVARVYRDDTVRKTA